MQVWISIFKDKITHYSRYSVISQNMAVENKKQLTLADVMESINSMKETLSEVKVKVSNLEKLEYKINEINENQNRI